MPPTKKKRDTDRDKFFANCDRLETYMKKNNGSAPTRSRNPTLFYFLRQQKHTFSTTKGIGSYKHDYLRTLLPDMFAVTPSVHGEPSQYNYIQTTVEGKGTQRNQMVKHKMGGHLPMVDMIYISAEIIFYFIPPRQMYFAAYLSSSPHGGGQVATVQKCIDRLIEKKKKVTLVNTLPPDGVADHRDTHGLLLHFHNSPSMEDLGTQYVSISWPECALVKALMDMFKRGVLFVDKGRGRLLCRMIERCRIM